MIFNRFILALLFALVPSFCFGYIFPVRTYTSAPSNTNVSDVGQTLAFEVFKASLTKNNISFTFPQYGLGSSFSINGVSGLDDGYSGSFSSFSNTAWVVLWPRTSIDASGVCLCDYTVFGTFHVYYNQAPTNTSSNAYYFYTYIDSGVVTVVNYLGSFYNTQWENKSVTIDSQTTCSMPFDYLSTSIIDYFKRPVRILNLTQSGTRTDPSSFGFGSIAELFSYQFRYSFLQGCGADTVYTGASKWFDLRSLQEINQSMLPWQLQIYNPSFDTSQHTKPNENFSADTDQGTEPDISEYYTGHDYLNDPSDDWGQPAEIGGGSSGGGGEITGFSSGAEGQMTSAGVEALEQYFGSSSDVDIPVLDSTPYTGTAEDPVLDSSWLVDPISTTGDMLPSGAGTFRSLVERLKNPDASTLPRFTLNFEVNTGNIAGVIWRGVHYDVDLATLKGSYPIIFTTLRLLAVVCMFVSVLIYVIKDNLFLGGDSTKEQ